MKLVEKHAEVDKFIKKFMNLENQGCKDSVEILNALITGKIALEKPSPNKINEQLVTGPSKATFYRRIHELATKMPEHVLKILGRLQEDPAMVMKPQGVISIDEHIIPHSSKKIEGVGYFYSTTRGDVALGMSLISSHYFGDNLEYPLLHDFFRKQDELEARGMADQYRPKNQVVRDMIEKLCSFSTCPDLFLFDSFFMTRDNARLLKRLGRNYISRPKRSWYGTWQGCRQSLGDIFDRIPAEDFKVTAVRNRKTGKTKYYMTATLDIFFKGLGTNRVIFIDVDRKLDANGKPVATDEDKQDDDKSCKKDMVKDGEPLLDERDVNESPLKRKFIVYICSNLEWDASKILSTYTLRWTIETCYRDLSQNIGLHGCQWRDAAGQHCFVGLSFICYWFLQWARRHGILSRYGSDIRTLGSLKRAFIHYCQDEFYSWLSELRCCCGSCRLALFLEQHVFTGLG